MTISFLIAKIYEHQKDKWRSSVNHREIFSQLLKGSTLRATLPTKSATGDSPWCCLYRMRDDQIELKYMFTGSTFEPVDNFQIGPYEFSLEEEAQEPIEVENIVFAEASAYTDGKEIRFFHGNAEEVSVDAFHKMKKIESFQLSVSRNNPLI